MKILHLHAGSGFGGVESVLVTFARERACCAELEQRFAVCFESQLSEDLRRAGVPVMNLGGAHLSRPWTVHEARKRLERHLAAEAPDAILCHMEKPVCLFGGVARRMRIPFVYYNHKPIGVDRGDIYDRLIRLTSKPDLVISVSQYTAELVRTRLFRDIPVEVVYNPMSFRPERSVVGPAARLALRREFATHADEVVIVQATRLDAVWKGHADLLRALGALRDLPGWWHWLIGGVYTKRDRAYVASLRDLATQLGIADRVRFIGFRSDVPTCLGSADIYCQANTLPEGLGMSFIEAMAASLPIVTTDLGPAREVIGADRGLLTPARDIEALSRALRSLVIDKEKRVALGQAGRMRADARFSADQQLRRLHDILRRQGFGASSGKRLSGRIGLGLAMAPLACGLPL
jgi:glycosyltransferase involved in cell wall biosynthesis